MPRFEPRVASAICEQSPIGIAHVDEVGNWTAVNASLSRILEYTEDELTARTWMSVTHPEDLLADQAEVDKLLAGDIETYSMLKRYITKTGRVIWVRLTVFPVTIDHETGKAIMTSFIEPLVNGAKVRYEQTTPDGKTTSKQELVLYTTARAFLLDNWKWCLTAAIVVITSGYQVYHQFEMQQDRLDRIEKLLEHSHETQPGAP